jgi:hypothetical protein
MLPGIDQISAVFLKFKESVEKLIVVWESSEMRKN